MTNREAITSTTALAQPFLKWAGGKSQLLVQFEQYFPADFEQYLEPFVGGGAVFFHLYNQGRITRATLSDSNSELVNCYRTIRDDVEELIQLLGEHQEKHSREHYYRTRSLDRQRKIQLSSVERAARMIYLNRTCYNGLWRVNRKGEFNVPMGRYKNPRIQDANNLRAVSHALRNVEIITEDFRQVLDRAQAGDFVYFDPPYVPLNETSSFTSYTAGDFGLQEQQQLAEVYKALSDKGCLVMLSNSDTPIVRELYAAFRIEIVKATRAINSKPDGRGEINELIILNYSGS